MYSVVEVTQEGEYGEEYATSHSLDGAWEAQNHADAEEGMHTEILKKMPLKDVYGIETDEYAWIPVEVLEKLGLEV